MTERCAWATTPLGIEYHDAEWGVPLHDDRQLFEFLVLEGAQAGLSWELILNRRESYREAFDGFDPAVVAEYGDDKVAELLANPGIVRNRQKVAARHRQCPRISGGATGVRQLRRLHLGFRGWRSHQERLAVYGRSACYDAAIRGDEPRPAAARLPVRRPHHLLRVYAGNRHGQRPYHQLLPLPRGGVTRCALGISTKPKPGWDAHFLCDVVGRMWSQGATAIR